MRMRCPTCYSEFGLEQMLADDAAREVMGLIAGLPKGTSRLLVQYTGLFRPKKQSLSWDRAYKIISEASELASPSTLRVALDQTLEAMRAKQRAGEWIPLKNHNYLKQVIKSVPPMPQPITATPSKPQQPYQEKRPPVEAPKIEKKAHRSPEEIKKARSAISVLMSGLSGHQSKADDGAKKE